MPRGKRYLAFTWWFVGPGQRCPRSTSLPRGKLMVIWSLRNDLNFFSFYTNCYREWILNTFTYFWCFLVLFIEKFIPDINNEHAQDYSCRGNFSVLFTWTKVTSARRVTRCCTTGNLPLEVALGQRQTHVNSLQAPDRAPRQSLPRGQWVVLGSCEQALTVHMSFSLNRGNFERRVTHCTTPGNPPCRGNFALTEHESCPGARVVLRMHVHY